MKITLVYPPWQFYSPSKLPPLGISYLASQLRHSGFDDVDVVDLNLEISNPRDTFKRSIELVKKRNADILGITCWTVHVPFCIEFVKFYKKKYPDVKIIMGGVHASSQPEDIMKLCPVDIIVRNEGEETFIDLLNTLDDNKEIDGVPGISYRQDGQILHTQDRPLIKILDSIPFPAYDLLAPLEQYQPLNRKYAFSLLASRGCPYRCIFCSANRLWKFQRRRSPENVFEEIKWLANTYEAGFIRFEDDALTINRDWAVKLFTLLKTLPIKFDCLTRIDKVDSNLLKLMLDAGCEGIYHGIESASPRLLNLLRKNFPSWINIEYIQNLITEEVSLGLHPTVSAMIGIPTETKEEINLTFDLMCDLKRLGARTQLWIMTPYPDTDAVEMYKENLIRIDRWREFKQFDVFSMVPREAYARQLKKYGALIPDNWMFKNEITDFQEMKELYLSGASRILGELEFV
jgi:anaerobic magnesium-protoporphyrin IX monomethyl ester cyclase